MARKYTNKVEVQNYLLQNIDSSFDSQIDSWIEQCSKEIETITQRIFQVEESDIFEERLFDGGGREKILVDDFVELDTVEINDREIDDVLQYPSNTIPKYVLFYSGGFPVGNQNIKVSAKWGYSEEAPDDIKFACTVFVAGIIKGQIKTDAEVTKEKIGNYEVTYDTEKGKQDIERAKNILKYYRKITI